MRAVWPGQTCGNSADRSSNRSAILSFSKWFSKSRIFDLIMADVKKRGRL